MDRAHPRPRAVSAAAAAAAVLTCACLLGAAAREGGALPKTLGLLQDRIAGFREPDGVRCWESQAQLEAFVAGLRIDPSASAGQEALVAALLHQVWNEASGSARRAREITAEAFTRTSRRRFPTERAVSSRRLRLGWRWVDLPERDLANYLATVRPLEHLRAAAARAGPEVPRAGLDEAAIEPARELAAVLAVALLKEAGRRARARAAAAVAWEDLQGAEAALAEAARLTPANLPDPAPPASHAAIAGVAPGPASEDPLERTLSVLRARNASSAGPEGAVAPEDLIRHEAEWAGLPVDPAASRALHEEALARVAADLYEACADENPGTGTLSGPEMARTVAARFPYITTIRGVVNLFPEAPGRLNVSIMDHQAELVRRSGHPGRAVESAARELAGPGRRRVPALDPYALDELEDFLSIYAVVLLRVAGSAESHFGGVAVTLETLAGAHDAFLQGSRQHHEGQAAARGAAEGAAAPSADGELRDALRSAYIGELFSDVTAGSGIDFLHESSAAFLRYRWDPANRGNGAYDTPESRSQLDPGSDKVPSVDVGSEGGGVAAADVDGDGLDDLFFPGGRRNRLYRNVGGLRFRDVTEASGLGAHDEESKAGYFVDYDNDGDQDLFVTQVRAPNRLYRNRGDGTFDDVTQAAGLPLRTDLASHSATWFDFDRDGFLDVYVGNFGDWLGGARPLIGENSRNGQPDLLYRNDGRGRFEDITERAAAGDPGWTHAVSHLDADGDGWQDVYVANDFGEDKLLLNEEGRRFRDGSPEALRQRFFHAMGVGFTDANGDGLEDIYVSNITMYIFPHRFLRPGSTALLPVARRTVPDMRQVEGQLFLVSREGSFVAEEEAWFDRTPEGCGWAWDADFLDFDNDGFEDLYVVNGREPYLGYDRERNVLYKQWRGRFRDVSRGSGADFPGNSRGAVHADLDGDGDLDVVVTNYHDRPVLLRNNLQRHNWVQVLLQGSASTRDGVGARVVVHAGGRAQARTVRGGSGFLSKEPFAVHVGLGELTSIERIEVFWPGGRRQALDAPAINRRHLIVERR